MLALLPRAGLGHSLLIWARALVFARINELPLQTVGWHQLRIGPWLRGERTKRYYGGYFQPDASLVGRLTTPLRHRLARGARKIVNPPVERLGGRELGAAKWVVFDELAHWNDYFRDLKTHRQFVRDALYSQIHPDLRREVEACAPPVIGVHARLGDFRPLKPGEDFAKVGAVRTPQTYFVDVIRSLRAAGTSPMPATIFSDGHREELTELLSLPDTRLAPPRADIVDMLLLSRSHVIVASAGSSFSYWAGFLSDAPVVLHPDHIHSRIRAEEHLYEGPIASSCPPAALIASLKQPTAQELFVREGSRLGD